MKKLPVLLVSLSVAVLLSFPYPAHNPLNARDGCCKQRDNKRDNWYENGLNFHECKKLNREEDDDNVYSERGRVWWDENC